MVMKYSQAPDLKNIGMEIVLRLELTHIDLSRVSFIRSQGSEASRTLARIHGLPRVWHAAFGIKPCYIIEVISEKFDKLSQEEQEKTLIHEILHISQSFGGGFRYHKNYVNDRKVDQMHRMYKRKRMESNDFLENNP